MRARSRNSETSVRLFGDLSCAALQALFIVDHGSPYTPPKPKFSGIYAYFTSAGLLAGDASLVVVPQPRRAENFVPPSFRQCFDTSVLMVAFVNGLIPGAIGDNDCRCTGSGLKVVFGAFEPSPYDPPPSSHSAMRGRAMMSLLPLKTIGSAPLAPAACADPADDWDDPAIWRSFGAPGLGFAPAAAAMIRTFSTDRFGLTGEWAQSIGGGGVVPET